MKRAEMDEADGTATKSSNEILSELFGAFNAEPPKIIEKSKNSTEAEDSDHSAKSKKGKRKKSKKKHKSKGKKHKRKHSSADRDLEGSGSSKVKKKKKKKERDKKNKKNKQIESPDSVNIELSVNQVPLALDIILDGTVDVKDDSGINKVSHAPEEEQISKGGSNEVETAQNDDLNLSMNSENSMEKSNDTEKTDEKKSVPIKVPEVFEAEPIEQSEKMKKGKIQIRNLKFSSVFQETVKAVEEKQKKELERKADIEEGELSESSESEVHSDCDDPMTGDRSKKKIDGTNVKYQSHNKIYYGNEDLRIHIKKRSSRSRRRSRTRSRSNSHSRSRSRHRSREKSRRKRRRSSRSRSKDYYSLHRSRSSHKKRSRKNSTSKKSRHSRSRERHRSRSRSRRSREKKEKIDSGHRFESKHRSKTKSKERSESVEKIDKEKLLAIARKNALKLIDAGIVPGTEKLATIKAGGKTVNELTEYCKKLSSKEALGKDVSDVESESSEDGDKPFHHPFQVRDRPNSIIMNIKNSIPLPVKSLQEKAAEQSKQLRMQFPVSSGSSHRRTENEWIPVSPKKEELPEKQVAVPHVAPSPAPVAFVAPLPIEAPPPVRLPQPQPLMSAVTDFTAVHPPEMFNRPVFPVIQPSPPMPKLDISSIVSKRLEAMRKLQENPNDSQALNEMYNAQQEMQYWVESKQDLGAFTGSTGVKVLSASELSSGAHAWAKRDQLTAATPVKGGMGMALLQKMGWQPGEGLGKNKEGTLEPLRLEVKMDKKGLVASDESKRGNKKMALVQQGPALPTVKTLDGKHPVSLLNEFCSRRRFGVPQFELCFECGPDHKKNFLFKVKVNGIEYTPTVASPNKKQAKAEAAAICLRALGVISNTN